MAETVTDPLFANLFASVLVFVLAIISYFKEPAIFSAHPYTRWAFHMWSAQWGAFAVLYIVLAVLRRLGYEQVPQGGLVAVISFVELTSICALAFFWTSLRGDMFRLQKILAWLGLLLFGILLWDVCNGLFFVDHLISRQAWIFPSTILSMFGLIAMGLVLVFRRGLAASPFLVFSILYAIAQVPAYSATFVTGAPIPRWFQALAVGKLLLVVSFYPAFFSPAKHHNPLGLSISLAAKFQLNQIAARLMSAAIYGMGTVVAEVIRIWVLTWLASFGWLPAK